MADDSELYQTEKRGLLGRLGTTLLGSLKFGAIGGALGGAAGAIGMKVAAAGVQIEEEAIEQFVEAFNEAEPGDRRALATSIGDIPIQKSELGADLTVSGAKSVISEAKNESLQIGALVAGAPAAAVGATFGAGTGWADKIKLERSHAAQHGHDKHQRS